MLQSDKNDSAKGNEKTIVMRSQKVQDVITSDRQAYANIKAILTEAGGSLQNIVKMTTFITHYASLEGYRKVRSQTFPEPCPPNTLLVVQSLASPDFMIEIEAVAVLEEKK